MRIHTKMAPANRVLAELRKLPMPEGWDPEAYVTPYVNGRENGWAVTFYRKGDIHQTLRVTFAEYRSSDSIVVYVEANHTWGNDVPSDQAWQGKMLFPYDAHEKAARYIERAVRSWKFSAGAAS